MKPRFIFLKKKVDIIEKKKASVSFSINTYTIDRGSSVCVFFLRQIDTI